MDAPALLTFSILLQTHTSKATIFFISSFLKVHVSEPYNTTLHNQSLYHPHLQCSAYISSQKFSPLWNASFPIDILVIWTVYLYLANTMQIIKLPYCN